MEAGSSAYQNNNGRAHRSGRASPLPKADCTTSEHSTKNLRSFNGLSPPGNLILEKAKEFGKEIQHLQAVTVSDGAPSEEIIEDIIKHERKRYDVDLKKALENDDARAAGVEKLYDILRKVRKSMNSAEVAMATSMGLLNSKGELQRYDVLSSIGNSSLGPMPHDAVPFSIWGWQMSQVSKFQNSTSDHAKQDIYKLIRNFQLMDTDDVKMTVAQFMKARIWGLGRHGISAVWNILGMLPELNDDAIAFAIFEGIKAVGENVIKFAIRATMLAIIGSLFTQTNGNAAVVMVILNDSKEDMRLKDMYIEYGKVVGTNKEPLDADTFQPVLPKRMPPIVNVKTGKVLVEGSIHACFFVARKRDKAFTGPKGVLQFEPTGRFPEGLFVGWEVPLAHQKSRFAVSAVYDGTARNFSISVDSENLDSQQSYSKSSLDGEIFGIASSSQERPAYFVISISSPPNLLPKTQKGISPEAKAAKISGKLQNINVPNATAGKTASQLIEDILKHEKEHHGIDWVNVAKEGDRAVHNAIYKAQNRLRKIAKQMTPSEIGRAKEMDLLNSHGDLKALDLLGNEDVGNPNLAAIPDGIFAFPCLGWNLEQAAKFQNAKGDEIKTLLLKVIRTFQLMENSHEGYLAHLFVEIGLWGVTNEAVRAVWDFVKVLDSVTAIAIAIEEFGLNITQLIISATLLAIFVPMIVCGKGASSLLLIVNDTCEDMNLEALDVTQGKITGIFKEKSIKNQRFAMIPKRQIPTSDENDVNENNGAIFAGIMVLRKKDKDTAGMQGAMKFAATPDYPQGMFVGWEVPLTKGRNKLLLSGDFAEGVESWSRNTSEGGKQEDVLQSSQHAETVGRVSGNNPDEAYYIISIGAAYDSLLKTPIQAGNLEENAHKLWSEIQEIKLPDYTSGKTSDEGENESYEIILEVISDIMQHEKSHLGIDWEAVTKGKEKGLNDAVNKAHERLHEIRRKMNDKEVEGAKSMGLLNSNGNVPSYGTIEARKPSATQMPTDAAPFTIWCWKKDAASAYQEADGEHIKDLIINLVRNFQVMGEDDERMMTKVFKESGLWALGSSGLQKVMQVLRTSPILDEATEVFAISSGITDVGINVIKLGIATMVITILVPLFTSQPKDAVAVCLLVNDSSDDLDLVEHHTTLGRIVGIFKENPGINNPKPIIPKRLDPVKSESGSKAIPGSVQAGIFVAQAKHNASLGTQGALKFGASTSFPKGVFVGWKVPPSDSKNRLLVSADYTGSTTQFSEDTNKEDKQACVSAGNNNAEVIGKVHSPQGNVGYYVFNVTEPYGDAAKGEPPVPLTKVAKSKTDEELINEILDHEKKTKGIDWKAALATGKDAIHEATKKARDHMQLIADKMTKEELGHARNMGLVDRNGKVPEFDLLAEKDPPVMLAATATTTPTVSIPSTATPYMVWGWKPSKAKEYEDSTGGDIKTKVVAIVHAFQAVNKDNKEQMANSFMKMGIWGVGLVGLRAAWGALRAAAAISEAVEIAAIADGIAAIGVSVVTMAIAACILAVIVPIFIFMSKNAAGIMVIINDSDEDMRMIDLHATHGKVVGIFKEKAELDNPQPILPKRLPPIVDPKTKKVVIEGSVQAGFFAARKRDNALVGTQGGMRFEATQRYPQGVYIGWEVPLSFTSNRLLVSATFTGSASEFSDKTNDHGKQDDSSQSSKGAVISGRVNSGSGSEAYYIFSIK